MLRQRRHRLLASHAALDCRCWRQDSRPACATARSASPNPLARPPHVAPKAKSVIFLFMEGGPSHIDTFDPKPG